MFRALSGTPVSASRVTRRAARGGGGLSGLGALEKFGSSLDTEK